MRQESCSLCAHSSIQTAQIYDTDTKHTDERNECVVWLFCLVSQAPPDHATTTAVSPASRHDAQNRVTVANRLRSHQVKPDAISAALGYWWRS